VRLLILYEEVKFFFLLLTLVHRSLPNLKPNQKLKKSFLNKFTLVKRAKEDLSAILAKASKNSLYFNYKVESPSNSLTIDSLLKLKAYNTSLSPQNRFCNLFV